ncbi:polyamine aminopropyltransferase [Tropicibacter naphthalenivorans]|uniref:Polyamine aminopropyltransferase n=1 Tax=Tropicibacter naphthalenivorans TaxID=441103 RepID=A0A0P1GL65_9RHOB|nr:polyamine aminopropyltransferase [Tropicibacter naphthalenivorans]CUH82506.1 Spermidine synthase [Tropicibacter naphthalenivorans]SMD06909.1 spermidine synthase [Tropicibacter naphthalenivorans]
MSQTETARHRDVWLLLATFLVAVAGLIYELIAATVSSYLLGDSVRQFSVVIGVFLSSMGVGAWLSRFVRDAMPGFVWIQILLGLVGGFMAPALFYAYGALNGVGPMLYGFLAAVGVLSGMEIPLIARVLEQIGAKRFHFENVLTVDYAGALIASLAFPLLIVPHLGLMSASLAFGLLNLLVAGVSLYLFRTEVVGLIRVVWALALVATGAALVQSEQMLNVTQARLFEDDVILSETTPYQNITVTQFRDRTRLFLDYSIQFDTLDEYRYHESLVHPAMGLAPRQTQVLILGGGDGMAVREVLRHDGVGQVTLVDLDPAVTGLFKDHPQLAPLNDHALSDPRVTIINQDAWQFIEADQTIYDVVILDLPDPKNLALSKLYSAEFYALLVQRIGASSVIVTQSGAPLFARQAFWSIVETWEQTANPLGGALNVLPYHSYVPSFGEWGFTMVSPMRLDRAPALPQGLRYLDQQAWSAAQVFAPDMARLEAEPNHIQTHALVGYYLDGWSAWFE